MYNKRTTHQNGIKNKLRELQREAQDAKEMENKIKYNKIITPMRRVNI